MSDSDPPGILNAISSRWYQLRSLPLTTRYTSTFDIRKENMKDPQNIFENAEAKLEAASEENSKLVKSDEEFVELFSGSTWYEIQFSKCKTHQDVIFWVYHLSEKQWVTRQHIRLFLSHLFCHFPELAPKH